MRQGDPLPNSPMAVPLVVVLVAVGALLLAAAIIRAF